MEESTTSSVPSESEAVKACCEIVAGPQDEPQLELAENYENGLFCGMEDVGGMRDPYVACLYGFEAGVERALDWAHSIAVGGLPSKVRVFKKNMVVTEEKPPATCGCWLCTLAVEEKPEEPKKFKCYYCGQLMEENWFMCSACASDF